MTGESMQPSAEPTGGGYLTLAEAADLARCNPETLRRAFRAGALPAFRPAHRVLLRESDVREWIETRSAVPAAREGTTRQRGGRRGARGRSNGPGSAADLRRIERELAQSVQRA